jgi:two-component system sensor histidine kinase UhpB
MAARGTFRDRNRRHNQAIGERFRSIPLSWQIFVPNALLLALIAAILALTPAHVSATASADQTIEVLVALAAILAINLILIRRTVAPLDRLTRLMARIDPLAPGERARVDGGSAELSKLAQMFNSMLDRLENERRSSAARMLSTQERERVRVARELHDEIGQSVTGLMLELDRTASDSPPAIEAKLREAQESARQIGAQLSGIVRRLRPEALDELGLRSALVALTERFSEQSSLAVIRRLDGHLPALSSDAELVVYRVAQESLTNIARHAEASRVKMELTEVSDGVRLRVSDDGHGIVNGTKPGNGIQGMRERAMLVGGRLSVGSPHGSGVEVVLHVPREASG